MLTSHPLVDFHQVGYVKAMHNKYYWLPVTLYSLLSHTEEGNSSLVSINNNPSNTSLQLKHLATYEHPKCCKISIQYTSLINLRDNAMTGQSILCAGRLAGSQGFMPNELRGILFSTFNCVIMQLFQIVAPTPWVLTATTQKKSNQTQTSSEGYAKRGKLIKATISQLKQTPSCAECATNIDH